MRSLFFKLPLHTFFTTFFTIFLVGKKKILYFCIKFCIEVQA